MKIKKYKNINGDKIYPRKMNHPINEIELSSNSSEYEHPNIDKGTLRRLIREKKMRQKEQKMNELNNIIKKLEEKYDPDLEKRKNVLEDELRPKLVETSSTMINNTSEDVVHDDNFAEYLLFLSNNSTLDNFISFIEDNRKIDLEKFDDFLIFNLTENIKEGLDDAGMVISRLSLYFKYLRQGGIPLLKRLNESLNDEKKRELFNLECIKYYEDSKNALLRLRNSND